MVEDQSASAAEVGVLRERLSKFSLMARGQDLRRTRYEWVYFVQADADPKLVKIGRAYRIALRLRALQGQCPTPIKLIGLVIAPRGSEFLFHEAWADRRVGGEWFLPTPELLGFIRLLPKAGRIEIPQLRAFARDVSISEARLKDLLLSGLRRKRRRRQAA